MLTEKETRKSLVYREGSKFVYDSGDLPDGLVSVGVGCVLCLQRIHGLSATQMPGNAEDWVVVGGGSGEGGGAALVIDSTLNASSSNPVQNKVVKNALDGKMDASQAFKTVNGQSVKGSGNIAYQTPITYSTDSSGHVTGTFAERGAVVNSCSDNVGSVPNAIYWTD